MRRSIRLHSLLRAVTVVAGVAPAAVWSAPQAPDMPVAFRAFDGQAEVTTETIVRIFPRGGREDPLASLGPGLADPVLLKPGERYDLQVMRVRGDELVKLRRIDAVLVQRYPEAPPEQLLVVNLQSRHGAVQLLPRVPPASASWTARAFPASSPDRPVATASPGEGYQLLVLPEGRYDVEIVVEGLARTWLRDVEVRADLTGMTHWP